ncbi:hypothetical protein [Opitutus sp. ER46]|uniref:hypothetical protein n=1 Tax=Opitutus sp. ER46 TaxID=2161864 RepID=UPI0011B299D3|nr:hypothetical protein [Opitutus sp. ER46]
MKRSSFLLLFLGMASLFLLSGCASGFIVNPETRSTKFTVERPFESAHQRAVQTFAALGGSITSQDAHAGTIAATVHNAVNMTVTLNRVSDTRTEVSVWGSTIPGKVVVGVFTEVDDFQRIYMEQR